MMQTAIDFSARRLSDLPTLPSHKARNQRALLGAFRRGERLTVATAGEKYHIYSLSQECGRLKRDLGWPILSAFIKLPSGKIVKSYWI